MGVTRLYVARDRLHDGRPPIAISGGGSEVDWAFSAAIEGPSRLVFHPEGIPAPDGSRRPDIKVWVETDCEVVT